MLSNTSNLLPSSPGLRVFLGIGGAMLGILLCLLCGLALPGLLNPTTPTPPAVAQASTPTGTPSPSPTNATIPTLGQPSPTVPTLTGTQPATLVNSTPTNPPTNTQVNTPTKVPTKPPTKTPTRTFTPTWTRTPSDTPTPTETPTPEVLLDLVQTAPTALWYSANGSVQFGGSDGDPNGFAVWRQGNYALEDGSLPPLALETHPNWATGGYIYGEYFACPVTIELKSRFQCNIPPPLTLQPGDQVHVKVGFLSGANAGNVVFAIYYVYKGCDGFCRDSLVSVSHAYGQGVVETVADLSNELGHADGGFLLQVTAQNEGAGQDWAAWAIAQVERPFQPPPNPNYQIWADGAHYVNIVSGSLPFRVLAGDNGKDGNNIAQVDMSVLDGSGTVLMERKENNAAYCILGGDAPCKPFVFADNKYTWPNGTPIINGGTYTLKAVISFRSRKAPLTFIHPILIQF